MPRCALVVDGAIVTLYCSLYCSQPSPVLGSSLVLIEVIASPNEREKVLVRIERGGYLQVDREGKKREEEVVRN